MLYYITGNKSKIDIAERYFPTLGIAYEIKQLDIVEIQSDNPEKIVLAKADEAYKQIKLPVLVNDHSWAITGLQGFPGAYMRYMNEWLSPQDFLNLTKDLNNREIILTEIVCYKDGTESKVFTRDHKGVLLKEIKGESPPCMTITSMTGDDITVAQKFENNMPAFDEMPIWEEFASWYKHHLPKPA